jgi:CDP-glucose 4,6-dehydratase
VKFRDRPVLVTGAHGFVASWLAKALLGEGGRVVAFDLGAPSLSGLALQEIEAEVEDVRGDLCDASAIGGALDAGGIEVVFHLGAQTIVGTANRSPLPTFEANIRGTWTLLEACRERDIAAVVVASSDKAYGSHDELPYREDFALQPTFPYDVSKAAADLIARSYWHTYGLPVAVTRFANIYGGGDLNFSRLIPEAACAAIDGRRPEIRSDGTPERDLLYVEDAARAYLAIAEALEGGKAAGEAFNAGGDRPYTVAEVVSVIAKVAGSDLDPDFQGDGTPAGEIDRQFLDSTKLRQATGWEPQVGLEEGLRRTIEWYRVHPQARPTSAAASG